MRSALWGSLLGLALDVLMLSAGRLNLWRNMGALGSFFDAQGRALLHGHLSVPASSVTIEGFRTAGKTYIYFGPVPAVFRMPLLLITHGLDGRLTQLSMLVAYGVLLWAGARVHWQVREFVRPGAPLRTTERRIAFVMALALGAGGVPLFLASWPVVYHESELWGAALSLAAFDAVLGVVARPRGKQIALASALSVLAVNARASVGAGPIVALILLALGLASRVVAAALELGHRKASSAARLVGALAPLNVHRPSRTALVLLVAGLVPLGSALAVNYAKFHTLVGLPLYRQVNTYLDPMQYASVVANHGSAFGLKFVPTTALAMFRPDAIGATRAFPFVGLPESPPTVIGNARFIALLPSLSAFTSMPLFCLLVLGGIPAFARRPKLGRLSAVLIGSAVALIPALAVSATATRYLADLLPFLWIAACAGLHALLALPAPSTGWGRRVRVVALGAGSVLVPAAILINGAVGLVQQQLLAPTTTPAQRASFVRLQDQLDRDLGRAPHGIHIGQQFPANVVRAGDLFILGRCAGLYVRGITGRWDPVERGDRSGLFELRVRFPPPTPPHPPEVLASVGDAPHQVAILGRTSPQRVVLSVRVAGRTVATGAGTPITPGRLTQLTLQIDSFGPGSVLYAIVKGASGGVSAVLPFNPSLTLVTGRDPSEPQLARFSGSAAHVPLTTPLCHRLARRAGLFG